MKTETQPITNLPQAVTDILTRLGHPRPLAWQKTLHPDAHITPDLGIQRFLINRCVRMHLGIVTTENTMDTRYCLVDTGEITDWLRLFEDGVAPTIVRLQLPAES